MKVSFIGPLQWSVESAHGLAKTYDESDKCMMLAGIADGRFLMYRAVCNDLCCGWLVVERLDNELFVWCYQGAQPDSILHALAAHAARAKLSRIGFFTRRRGWSRRMQRYMPDVARTLLDGEVRFTLDVKEICRNGSQKV